MVARRVHNPEVPGSNPGPATFNEVVTQTHTDMQTVVVELDQGGGKFKEVEFEATSIKSEVNGISLRNDCNDILVLFPDWSYRLVYFKDRQKSS